MIISAKIKINAIKFGISLKKLPLPLLVKCLMTCNIYLV